MERHNSTAEHNTHLAIPVVIEQRQLFFRRMRKYPVYWPWKQPAPDENTVSESGPDT